ncbi:hypothetical protein YC2023_108522 [Brassica napus]
MGRHSSEPTLSNRRVALLITSQEWFERLMLAGQMNIRRMSGDWIASVCRLCARAPNYRPTILLSFFTSIKYYGGDSKNFCLAKHVCLQTKDDGQVFVCSHFPCVCGNMTWVRFRRGSLRNGYHIQGRQQARKLPNPDTGTTKVGGSKSIRYRPSLNHKRCRQGSADVALRTPQAPYEKSKFLGSGGSMVARLKLNGIDGRAPPGVEPAA